MHRHLDEILRAMARRGVEEQGVPRLHQIGAVPVPVSDLSGQHVDELDAGMAEMGVGHSVFGQRDQIRLDTDRTAERMTQEIVEMSGLGTAALDPHARSSLDERAVPSFVALANKRVMGTLSALARASSVPSDGEILPFSIFESIPAEIPAAAPSSATVRSIDLRNRRTWKPMLASRGRAESSLGAAEPVRRSASESGSCRCRTAFVVWRAAARRCFRDAICSPLRLQVWNAAGLAFP